MGVTVEDGEGGRRLAGQNGYYHEIAEYPLA